MATWLIVIIGALLALWAIATAVIIWSAIAMSRDDFER